MQQSTWYLLETGPQMSVSLSLKPATIDPEIGGHKNSQENMQPWLKRQSIHLK